MMKKTILLFLVITLAFSFSPLLNAGESKRSLEVKPRHRSAVMNLDPAEEQAKRQRYSIAKQRKDEIFAKISSGADLPATGTPSAVDIQMYTNSTHWQADSSGYLVWTGACYNDGSDSAIFVTINIAVYDNADNLLGEDYAYLWGGTNSKILSTGTYHNAIGSGESGFFRVWTDISYANADYLYYYFEYYTYTHTPANAMVDFSGDVYYRDYLGSLDFFGNVKNSSSNWITYFTVVAFAVLDSTNTYVLDVDWDYIDGSSYEGSSSALYPGEIGAFDLWFLFADYSETDPAPSYLHSFEWDETLASSLPEKDPPFGEFSTPLNGANVSSSIPVTGWALDDSGVEHVKIYREEGNDLVFIGDASFVEGARPDVAALYPEYPNSTRAGWGYMMLTNFLPNGGNGTYVLHAIATDVVGKTTTLGTKTIHCDNEHAVKPFGAIDTPSQGGTASGNSFINWGWVLTPQPNSIPTDGSTLRVFVDSVNLGHPTYNIYRTDLANYFPGYANSSGAAGYMYLDTTAFSNGVHTIQWTAKDSGGNSDGIGSRYFTISNTNRSAGQSGLSSGTARKAAPKASGFKRSPARELPANLARPVLVQTGYNEDSLLMAANLDENGMNQVKVREMERVEIHLTGPAQDCRVDGYLALGNRVMALPVGSNLDSRTGVFSWIPGPGHLGHFHLVFVVTEPDGSMSNKHVLLDILPQQYELKPGAQ
jgi:hypothetical protein